MKRSAMGIAWGLLGVLAIAATLIGLGKREFRTRPYADNYGPSGLRALADLLQKNGYHVTDTDSPVADFHTGDIVITPVLDDNWRTTASETSEITKAIDKFTTTGGVVVKMPFPESFGTTQDIHEMPVRNAVTRSNYRTFMRSEDSLGFNEDSNDDEVSTNVWETGERTGVGQLTRHGKGLILSVGDGLIAANRYIDQGDNATLMMAMIETVAPKGSHIVFAEATFAGDNPSLIDSLGPAAIGIWYQAIFLFVVIAFTLGKRFGLPEELRPTQVGQRDLVDAIADTYRRGKAANVACRATYNRSDSEIRKALKLASETAASERDRRIPESLAKQFRSVFEGSIDRIDSAEAFKRCKELRSAVDAFLHRPH